MTSNELQLEEKGITSAITGYDKLLMVFKRRTETENFADKIIGNWYEEKVEILNLDGKVIESMPCDVESCWKFDERKILADDKVLYTYNVECGCLILNGGKSGVWKIAELNDSRMIFEYYSYDPTNDDIDFDEDEADAIYRLYLSEVKIIQRHDKYAENALIS